MKKENLDREALLLLKALVETQNLVRAAQSLDMPAATASRTLARLRDLFCDTLFTRCAGGLTPTARALELAAKAQAVLSDMDKLLEPAVFDPASLKRSFRIACVDHGVFFVAPAAAQTARLAPGVELEIVEFANNWASDLQNGELDFAISPVDEIPADCMSLTLEHCRSVLLMRKDHPLALACRAAGKGPSLEDILKFRFVELVFRPTWLYRRMMTMGPEAWRERSVAVRTPYFFSAVEMVKHSDLLLKASEMLTDTVLPGGSLAAVPVPDVLHADFEPKLIWNRRTHTDPAAQWLRSLIAGSVSHKTS